VSDALPCTGLCFEVIADGRSLGSFSECTGLTSEVTAEEYREGGVNHFVYKLPTHVSHASIVLKRGITASEDLWTWAAGFAEKTEVSPRTVEVHLNGPDGTAVRSWVATNAYPVKWEGPSLDARRGEVALETLELAHQGLAAGRT
jgi:phage tail-like protein